jgi:3-hydroxyisobutyrate dehydrogenase
MTSIAFIGLGNMGGPMAANLVKAGHKVTGFDLVEASRAQARADGVTIADKAVDAVKGAEVIITMLPAGKHVVSVWSEVIPVAAKGALMIDCSTIDVESARKAHELAAAQKLPSVDAPVSGGTGGAKGATLTFMAGGDAKAFASAKPVLEAMGKKIVHCGDAGGQDLQQHDPRHFDDRRQRSLRARRETRPVASGAVRCGLDLVGPVLVADHLLPGAGTGADIAGQQ